jgi:hypothetical protein
MLGYLQTDSQILLVGLPQIQQIVTNEMLTYSGVNVNTDARHSSEVQSICVDPRSAA